MGLQSRNYNPRYVSAGIVPREKKGGRDEGLTVALRNNGKSPEMISEGDPPGTHFANLSRG